MFAFYLTTQKDGMESDITFGYYDTSKFSGKIQWHPIKFKYMFGLQLDDVLLDGESLGFCGPEGTFSNRYNNGTYEECLITVDSGTTYIAFPHAVYDQLSGKGVPTGHDGIACKDAESVGDLTWVIEGKSYSLGGEQWIT